jgi:2-phospho-L-lactate transferase/gluconeogenesis factor (CofD/UPF0052 family)
VKSNSKNRVIFVLQTEFLAAVHTKVLEFISQPNRCIVYGLGSFYTSIGASLILRGVGEAIQSSKNSKILLINGSIDR